MVDSWTPESSLPAKDWTVYLFDRQPFDAATLSRSAKNSESKFVSNLFGNRSVRSKEASRPKCSNELGWIVPESCIHRCVHLVPIPKARLWYRSCHRIDSRRAHHIVFRSDQPLLFKPLGFLLIEDFKISLTIVAAFLTIIGYSLNDTIVVFDRFEK